MYHSRTARQSTTWWIRPMLLTLILFAAIAAGVSPHFNRPVAALSPDIVISQVYGGGGAAADSTYANDFVELFNRGPASVDLSGWSIQYASATGTGLLGGADERITLLSGTLQPGQYLLIEGVTSALGGGALPTPDITDATPIDIGGSSGKIALVTSIAALGCNGGTTACEAGQLALIKDLVGYGTATFFEGAAAAPSPNPSARRGALRTDSGCTDTDNNSTDFTNTLLNPRNTASPLNPCYPNTIIDTSPPNPSSSADAEFTFSADEPATFECRLDSGGGGVWEACTSPQPYTGLADGSHTFEVKATNTRGNTDPTPASWTWLIDTTSPNTTIDTGPTDPSNSADAEFTFSADEPGTFECRLDGGAWATCASPKNYTGLADGSHTFEVMATDAANNPDLSPASWAWLIDTTPPDTTPPNTTIDTSPTNPSSSADATFTFSADEPSTFECRLDGGVWATCTSPKNYIGLADDSHTFEVKATDAANNTDPTPASWTWVIDTVVPSTPILASTLSGGSVGGVNFGPEDILAWDGSGWSIWFDGSNAGLMSKGKVMHNINAFAVPDPNDNDVIMSFAQNKLHVLGIVLPVEGTDLVRWDGAAFSFYFDGSDVGLKSMTQEKIDALHILPGSASPINGGNCLAYLLISTQGPGKVNNHSGGVLRFSGEDVLGFCMTSSGDNTVGLWHMALDGSAEGMPPNSLVNLSASDDGQVLYLTTRKNFNVDMASGGHSMVYRFDRGTGLFSGPFFSAPATGLTPGLDGLQVMGDLP